MLEVVRQDRPAGPHEIENVPEHSAIPVNEVVLLEGVEHDGDPAAEHPGQSGLRKPAARLRSGHVIVMVRGSGSVCGPAGQAGRTENLRCEHRSAARHPSSQS